MQKKQDLLYFRQYKGNNEYDEIPLNRKSTRAKLKKEQLNRNNKHALDKVEREALRRINEKKGR